MPDEKRIELPAEEIWLDLDDNGGLRTVDISASAFHTLPEVQRLRERIKELEAGLKPFANVFWWSTEGEIVRSEHRRNWNKRMPGEWPITLSIKMDDGRNALKALGMWEDPPDRALLSQAEGGEG